MEAPGQKNFLCDAVLPKVERIGWLLAVLGFGFKYCLVVGADMLLMVGLATLATVCFLQILEPTVDNTDTSLNFTFEPVSPNQLTAFMPFLASKIQSQAGAVTLLGILFKLLFWKGAAVMLPVGTLLLTAAIAIRWAAGYQSQRALLIAGLGALAWALPTETMVRQFYRDDSVLIEKMLYQHQHPNDSVATAEVLRLLRARRRH